MAASHTFAAFLVTVALGLALLIYASSKQVSDAGEANGVGGRDSLLSQARKMFVVENDDEADEEGGGGGDGDDVDSDADISDGDGGHGDGDGGSLEDEEFERQLKIQDSRKRERHTQEELRVRGHGGSNESLEQHNTEMLQTILLLSIASSSSSSSSSSSPSSIENQFHQTLAAAATDADGVAKAITDMRALLKTAQHVLRPSQRRKLVASIALHQLKHPSVWESFPRLTEATKDLFDEFVAQHKRLCAVLSAATSSHLPIFQVHFSKAGGTSLCNLARDNNCTLAPEANNCWINGNGPVWFASFYHREITCERYMDMYREHHMDVMANEAYLDGGDLPDDKTTNFKSAPPGPTPPTHSPQLCEGLFYITILREPLSRVVSHMNQHGVKPEGYKRKDYETFNVEKKLQTKPGISNNYVVRFLLGKRAYLSSLGALNSTHLHQAMNLLLDFHVVLTLDWKREASRLVTTMIGWQDGNLDSHAGRLNKNRAYATFPELSPEDQALIRKHNELDIALFELSKAIFRLDWMVFGREGLKEDDLVKTCTWV